MNEAGYNLSRKSEGLRLKAYKCPAGIWTIGYGATRYEDGSKVKEGDLITKERAEELLKNLMSKFEKSVKRLVQVQLNDNQFSALVDFSYNVGTGNFANSTLLRKLNAGDTIGASKEFERWVYSKGVKLPGLVKRRKAERKLFLK